MGSGASRKPSERLLRIIAGLISLVGLGIASYIMIEQIQDRIPTCGPGGGCGTVLSSKYAQLFGVPLYYFGVLGYISIFITTLISGDRGRMLGFVLSFFGFGMSAYLTFLQYVVIESICVWCRGSAIAMTITISPSNSALTSPRVKPSTRRLANSQARSASAMRALL